MSAGVSPHEEPGYTHGLVAEEPAASIRKATGAVPRSRLLDGLLGVLSVEELLRRYMPEDARGRTLGACGDFGCFLLAGVP